MNAQQHKDEIIRALNGKKIPVTILPTQGQTEDGSIAGDYPPNNETVYIYCQSMTHKQWQASRVHVSRSESESRIWLA
jgi:hypothetical protein